MACALTRVFVLSLSPLSVCLCAHTLTYTHPTFTFQGADLAIKKVKKQISLTKKNKALIVNAIKAMTKQRRDVVKRLKTKKLTRDLEQAETKMKQLQEYGAKLGATKMSLVQGTTTMKRRVGVLSDGIKQLRQFGADPEMD